MLSTVKAQILTIYCRKIGFPDR